MERSSAHVLTSPDADGAGTLGRRGFLGLTGRAGVGALLLRSGALGTTGLAVSATAAVADDEDDDDREGPAHRYDAAVLDDWYATLYSGIMEGNLTPGRAARAYALTAVAAYETVVPGASSRRSLAGQVRDLRRAPRPRGQRPLDWTLAVSAAVAALSRDVHRAGKPELLAAIDAQLATHLDARRAAGVRPDRLDRALAHGDAVGRHIAAWARTDGAEETYTLPYTPPVGPSLWRSTPPNFGTAIDPYWGQVRTMALPNAAFCAPDDPPATFSTAEGSAFWEEAQAVLRAADTLTDEGKDISLYWRDNPLTSGLPAGHWVRLTLQVCAERGRDLVQTAEVLAVTAIALHDAFVSCWHEKYTTNLLRPISYIQAHVPGRETWASFVNTPQFPEYTSGHSVASQAAATVLTARLGTLAFTDRSHDLRNPQLGHRSFASFQAAADEAANSRLLGGIHYPMGISVGLTQGDHVGRTVLRRIRTRRDD